jgi:high-affinity iron transporter
MALLLLFLSVGLFVGGCHEFEEVYGETDKVYNIGVKRSLFEEEGTSHLSYSERFLTAADEEAKPEYTFWSEKKLPMALLKPFGYSAGRTQLQIACFWSWLVFGIVLHAWKYVSSKKIREAQDFNEAEEGAAAHGKDLELQETEAGGKGSQGTDEENVSAEDVEADVA